MNASFSDMSRAFRAFLGQGLWTGAQPVQTRFAPLHVLITPWHGTPIPFFSLLIAIAARHQGRPVYLIWDDCAWHPGQSPEAENQAIATLLPILQSELPWRRVSQYAAPAQGLDSMDWRDLSRWNAIWKERGAGSASGDGPLADSFLAGFQRQAPLIAATLEGLRGTLLVPGGLNGGTGLWLRLGRQKGLRVATYDCGPGFIIGGSRGIAGHLEDIGRLWKERATDLTPEEKAKFAAIGRLEFAKRESGDDAFRFQKAASGLHPVQGRWDVVLPLNVPWDTAALGRHTAFRDGKEWAEATVTYLLRHTQATVAVRQHPRESLWESKFSYLNPLRASLAAAHGTHPRFRFIAAEEAINTYDLLRQAKLVLPSTSTVGLEALCLGRPVALDCPVYYSDLPGVIRAESQSDYWRAIDRALGISSQDLIQVDTEAAWLQYYFSQVHNRVFTEVTGMPEAFEAWVKRDFRQVLSDTGFQRLCHGLWEDIPVAWLQHQSSLTQAPRMTALPPSSSNASTATRPAWESQFPTVSFGDGVQILGLRETEIGEGSCIGDHSWVNVCERDGRKRLRIGRCVLIGRNGMISTGGDLEIGDYCLFAPRVYVSDADHVFTDIYRPYMDQGATLGRCITVEENCWLGINTVVSGNLVIGRGSVVAANSVVLEDVPPFSVVAGTPARVIKLFNPATSAWEKVANDGDILRVLEGRSRHELPDREAYRDMLRLHSPTRRLDPILAGRGMPL